MYPGFYYLKIQNPEEQKCRLLKNTVYVPENVYLDKASGKNFDEQATRKCLKQSKKGISLL